MAATSPAETFRAEASCSLCLQLFQDPVSIHCGHNFCRSCITRRWQEGAQTFSCPRCWQTAPERNLRPNRELAKIIEVAQRLSLRAARVGAGRGQRLCPEHGEALKLFCEEEQTLICLVCRESQEHRPHGVVPIEEAAEEQKEKLQAHVRALKDRREKLLGRQAAAEEEGLGLLEQLATERRKVVAEAAALRRRVEEQERLLLARLARLGREVAGWRQETVEGLREEVAAVGEKIHRLEEKCRQPASDFLQDSRSILSSLEQDHDPAPAEASPEPGEKPPGLPPHNVAFKEMLRRFQVSLTLDPETAHPHLVLSEDLKGARWDDTRRPVPNNPKRFDSSRCVLGGRAFRGGQHYWEVVVGNGQAWAVGVAKESVRRKGRVNINPAAGIWAVGRCGGQHQALTSPATCLALPAAPEVIGVYLDYEAGRVTFFDAKEEAAIFAYAPAAFGGEQLFPLLCLGRGCQVNLAP